jgi:integrase
MGRETSARQDHAHPLGWKEIKDFIDGAGESLRADRERAMLCVTYETLARRGELVALEVRDIISIRMARGRRSFHAARRMPRGRGGRRTCHGRL